MDIEWYEKILDFPPPELGNARRVDPRNPLPEDEVRAFRLGVEDQRIVNSWEEAFKAAAKP